MTKRTYRKTARAASEKATGEAILKAAKGAFSEMPFDHVTLRQIADESGVTVQTVIRRFGSKEQLFEAVAKREGARIVASREVDEDAGRDAALEALLNHYEVDGDMTLNFIAQEHLFAPVHRIVENGRRVHREWVQRYCSDLLGGAVGAERDRRLYAAIAATDLGTWKLLRRDLDLEQGEVTAVMKKLLNGLQHTS